MRIKALILSFILMCAAYIPCMAETAAGEETTELCAETYQDKEIGKYPSAVSGVNYTVETGEGDNRIGRAEPKSSAPTALHRFAFDTVNKKLAVEMDILMSNAAADTELKIGLGYAGKEKTNFVITKTGISGNGENPSADICDYPIKSTSMTDGKWHKTEIIIDVTAEKYSVMLDSVQKTPKEGYFLRNCSFEEISSGISGVSFTVSGNGGAVMLDNIKISKLEAKQADTAATVIKTNLSEALKDSVVFAVGSPLLYKNGIKNYIDGSNPSLTAREIDGKIYVPAVIMSRNINVNGEDVKMNYKGKPLSFKIGEKGYTFGTKKAEFETEVLNQDCIYISAVDFATLSDAKLYTVGDGIYTAAESEQTAESCKGEDLLNLLKKNLYVNSTPEENADGIPQVFHNSGTVYPNETAMLYGWNFDLNTTVEISCINGEERVDTQTVTPSQITKNSVKFVIPETYQFGIYGVKVKNASGASSEIVLNRADPWWFMGDSYDKATAGGWIKIMGKTLSFGNASVTLKSESGEIHPTITEQDEYGIRFAVSENTAPGTYDIIVNNGLGGGMPVSFDTVEIEAKTVLSRTKYDVSQYKVKNNDYTEVIQNALNLASGNGGCVYFPAGRYGISKQIVIPEGVSLEGEGKGLVSLYFIPDSAMPNPIFAATDNFEIKNIDIYVQGDHNNILAARNNFKLIDCTFRVNAYYHHVGLNKTGGSYSYSHATKDVGDLGFAVFITGDRFEINGCDILCSGQPLELRGATYGIITNNVFAAGKNPYQAYGIVKVMWENNTFRTNGLYSNGMGMSLYYNSAASYFNYFKGNTFRDFYGGDREALTFDGHGTAFLGGSESVEGSRMTLTSEPTWGNKTKDMIEFWDMGLYRRDNDREWHGVTVYILDGKGAGQSRNLVGCDGRTIELDKAWDINPDENSVISIGKFNGRDIFDKNTFTDVGPSVQIYPPGYGCIISRNTIRRAVSANAGGQITNNRVEPNWFSEFVDNVVEQGNAWANESFLLHAYGTNDINNMPIARGHIFRRNILKNNATIRFQGAIADIITEGNSISNSPMGIYIRNRQNNCPQDYILRNNTFENVGDIIYSGQ